MIGTYLLDANVLITAHNQYYPMDRVPQFWRWLLSQSGADRVKIPEEIIDEIKGEQNPVAQWCKEHRDTLMLQEEAQAANVERVYAEGYGAPDDTAVERIGNDPFLMAYALADAENRCVVTLETRKPSRKPHNRKIPDVCETLSIPWRDTFGLIRVLDFRIPEEEA